mgnify:FL=1
MKNIIKKQFSYSFENYLLIIIGINVFVFLLTSMKPSLLVTIAMNPVMVITRYSFWQFITYMFAHANMSHIFFNMLGLFSFGFPVERTMGSREFLLFYFFCGIAAGIFSFLVYYTTGNYRVFLLGASGVVYAVLLAYALYFPDSLIYIMGIVPVKALYLVIGYTAIELFSHISNPYSGVAHLTHLAGFAFAYIYFMVRLGINPADVFFRRR